MGILKHVLQVKRLFLLLFLLSVLTSCWQSLKHFTFYNATGTSNNLRINGVYFRVLPPELISNYEKNSMLNGFVLYQNGTYLAFNFHRDIHEDLKNEFKWFVKHTNDYNKEFPYSPDNWGAYRISADTLYVQYFVSYENRTSLHTRYYLIRDSTTIEKIMSGDREGLYAQKKYNFFKLFEKMKQKPDSVNVFMMSKRVKRKLERLYEKRNHKQ